MATFSVGQRVRINWSNSWPELAGQTGRIVGEGSVRPTNRLGWAVAPDAWGSEFSPRPGDRYAGRRFGVPKGNGQISPLIPDGMQPAEWSDCLWQPESELETVR